MTAHNSRRLLLKPERKKDEWSPAWIAITSNICVNARRRLAILVCLLMWMERSFDFSFAIEQPVEIVVRSNDYLLLPVCWHNIAIVMNVPLFLMNLEIFLSYNVYQHNNPVNKKRWLESLDIILYTISLATHQIDDHFIRWPLRRSGLFNRRCVESSSIVSSISYVNHVALMICRTINLEDLENILL